MIELSKKASLKIKMGGYITAVKSQNSSFFIHKVIEFSKSG